MGDIKMNNIEIFNETNEKIDEIVDLKDFIDYSVKYLKIDNPYFNIIFIDNEKIRQINKEYRNIDKETDVISFALEDDKTFNTDKFRFLGDIYISIDKAKSQAKNYGHSLKREICFLSIHGILHLLGYDHMNEEDEKIMFNLQEEILSSYGIKR